MSIPDHEREESQADAGLLEYIDRRRLYEVRQRRQRVLVGTVIGLGALAAVLAVSNVILFTRLNAGSEAPPPASVASAPPAAPVPEAPAPAAPSPPPPAAPAPGPVAPATPPTPDSAVEAPPPAALAAPVPPGSARRATAADDEGDSARRTAQWLVQTHGRIEAENRAAKVAEFYSGEQGAFWHRVLLNVRQEPER